MFSRKLSILQYIWPTIRTLPCPSYVYKYVDVKKTKQKTCFICRMIMTPGPKSRAGGIALSGTLNKTSYCLVSRNDRFSSSTTWDRSTTPPQVRRDKGSNSRLLDHDSTLHVTETPSLTTRPSVNDRPFKKKSCMTTMAQC